MPLRLTADMIDKSVSNIDKHQCCGCMMCGDACPKGAISFPITKGFWYPSVVDAKCINCGICNKKCPVLNVNTKRESTKVDYYGVKTKNDEVRWHSTSGGFFTELANYVIERDGLVIGALYDGDNCIVHAVGRDKEDITKLRQSKYAQSNTSGIYIQVKDLLNQNKQVLFCGTPCQVEALYAFLGNRPENLITMDFICLGICSPWIFRKYLDMLESKYISKAKRVWFKNKTNGWRAISNRIDFENGETYLRSGKYDLFMRLFVTDALSMRSNCENCKFRSIHHISDFTVGDFWGVEKVNPEIDDNKGISALCVNTDKAQNIFSQLKSNLDYFKTDADSIVKHNFSVLAPMKTNPNQDLFMEMVDRKGLIAASYKYSSFNRRLEMDRIITNIKICIKTLLRR